MPIASVDSAGARSHPRRDHHGSPRRRAVAVATGDLRWGGGGQGGARARLRKRRLPAGSAGRAGQGAVGLALNSGARADISGTALGLGRVKTLGRSIAIEQVSHSRPLEVLALQAVLKAQINKTDRNDARGIAQISFCSWQRRWLWRSRRGRASSISWRECSPVVEPKVWRQALA